MRDSIKLLTLTSWTQQWAYWRIEIISPGGNNHKISLNVSVTPLVNKNIKRYKVQELKLVDTSNFPRTKYYEDHFLLQFAASCRLWKTWQLKIEFNNSEIFNQLPQVPSKSGHIQFDLFLVMILWSSKTYQDHRNSPTMMVWFGKTKQNKRQELKGSDEVEQGRTRRERKWIVTGARQNEKLDPRFQICSVSSGILFIRWRSQLTLKFPTLINSYVIIFCGDAHKEMEVKT